MSKPKKTLTEDLRSMVKKHGYAQCIAMVATRESPDAEVIAFGMTKSELRSYLLQLVSQLEGAIHEQA